MDVYYFVIAITFFLCYLIKVPDNDSKAYLKKVCWVFVPIALFGAFRVNFGHDYTTYEEWYHLYHSSLSNISKDDHSEIGYQILNYYVPSWRMMLILVSTLVVSGYVLIYSKYVEPKMLMVAMLFTMFYPDQTFFIQFVTMRNGIAIAGTYLCLPLIIRRKYIWVFAIAYALSLFHSSALLFLPFALIVGLNRALCKKEIYIWISVAIIFSLISTTSLSYLLTPLLAGDQFESYRESYLAGDTHSSLLNCVANAGLMFVVLTWAYRNRDILTKAQNTIWRLGMLYLLSPFLGSFGRTRMTNYFIPFYIITITMIMGDRNVPKYQKLFFICLATAIMIYATFVVWMGNPYFVFDHYQSIFND